MDNMIKEIGLLQEYDQIQIRNDIEKKIIPQALDVLRETPCEFKRYIEQEIESAKNAKIKMIKSFYLPGAIHYNISKIYVYNDERLKALNELRKSVKEEETKTIPNELKTDIAKKWLTKAIENGFLNYDYLTTDKLKTKAQKALFAECFSEKIGLKYKYVYFETLWGVSGLSKIRYKSKEEVGKVKGGEPIEEFFKQD